MSEFKRHPLSAAFPTFAQEDLAALAEDIRQFGQRESGLMLDGMVLDGWNRYCACQLAGIEFNWIEFDDEHPDVDPVAFVLSKNLHRRHLTASQRAAAVVACAQWAPAGNPNLAPGARLMTNSELAREADVSPRTISHAKAAHEAGLGDAVIAGAITLKQADAQIKAARKPAEVGQAIDGEEGSDGAPAVQPFSLPHSDEQSSPRLPRKEDASLAEAQSIISDLREQLADVSQAARDLELELDAYRSGETGEGEKKLIEANKRIAKLEAECRRLETIRDDWMNKHAEALKEIKRLKRQLERGHA
ncbi:hypothetical protein AWB77_04810 [Caballeronia fortuita]|uniref:Uncharacterized protein n=1 Tax=Caballeronia fortuita TaxID=1777138 RepID=A0A158D284_9BURK|nr:hypothetical protein [Caballeronia fortuita]SAK88679.1 hypothetical protein AWB77_04810 [Caballeronia fortuita]